MLSISPVNVNRHNIKKQSFKSKIEDTYPFFLAVKQAANNPQEPASSLFFSALKTILNDGKKDIIKIAYTPNKERFAYHARPHDVFVNGKKIHDSVVINSNNTEAEEVMLSVIKYAKDTTGPDSQDYLVLKTDAYYDKLPDDLNKVYEQVRVERS